MPVLDMSFGELLVIGAVTLIVVGPERMPKVARTAGMLLGRLQRFIANVKSEIHQEMQMGELAKLETQLREGTDDLRNSIHQPFADAAAMLAEGAQMPPTGSDEDSSAALEHAIETLPALPNSAYRDRR
ncbi:twin-arginine translocase subunit TatB [Deefgea sp. CFH1-16]|nr:twin-arginine translocase subunit TatB [Deefgea sp. CFH1-16]